uniref:LNS2 domain-containing protein n=1 Tax=Trichuris muris TaxID=70415 RepID=A0A5S6QCQ0_TRIMR
MDVLVVVGPDGKWEGTPFHVRFGKFRVFLSRGKKVCIEINGQHSSIHMKLNCEGKAYFPSPRAKPGKNGRKVKHQGAKSWMPKTKCFSNAARRSQSNKKARNYTLYDLIPFIGNTDKRAHKQEEQRKSTVVSTKDFFRKSNFAIHSPMGTFSTVDWGYVTYAGMRRSTISRADVLASGPSCIKRERPEMSSTMRDQLGKTERSRTVMDMNYLKRLRQIFKLRQKKTITEKKESFQPTSPGAAKMGAVTNLPRHSAVDKVGMIMMPYTMLISSNVSHGKARKERLPHSDIRSVADSTPASPLTYSKEYEAGSECKYTCLSERINFHLGNEKNKRLNERLIHGISTKRERRDADYACRERAANEPSESRSAEELTVPLADLKEERKMDNSFEKNPAILTKGYEHKDPQHEGKGNSRTAENLTAVLNKRKTGCTVPPKLGNDILHCRRLNTRAEAPFNERDEIAQRRGHSSDAHRTEEADRILGELLERKVGAVAPSLGIHVKVKRRRKNLLMNYYKENIVRNKRPCKRSARARVSRRRSRRLQRQCFFTEKHKQNEATTQGNGYVPGLGTPTGALTSANLLPLLVGDPPNKHVHDVINPRIEAEETDEDGCRAADFPNQRFGKLQSHKNSAQGGGMRNHRNPTGRKCARLDDSSLHNERCESSYVTPESCDLMVLPMRSPTFIDPFHNSSPLNASMDCPVSMLLTDAANQQSDAAMDDEQKAEEVHKHRGFGELAETHYSQEYASLFAMYSRFVHPRPNAFQEMFTSKRALAKVAEPTIWYPTLSEVELSKIPELVLSDVRRTAGPRRKLKRSMYRRRLSSFRPRKISYRRFFMTTEDSMLNIAVRFTDVLSELREAYVRHKVVREKYRSCAANDLNNYLRNLGLASTCQSGPVIKFTRIWFNRSQGSGDEALAVDSDSALVAPELNSLEDDKEYLYLKSKHLKRLGLKPGLNTAKFFVSTQLQGIATCECNIYLWNWSDKIVASDIDGTITKSDILGHFLPLFGHQWIHRGVAKLLSKIHEHGYQILYLSSRSMGQSQMTKDYLTSIKEGETCMPDGPLLLAPLTMLAALHQEVVMKTPHIFKAKCLQEIKNLFPSSVMPFHGAFGNQATDIHAYASLGIPLERIFRVNPHSFLVSALQYVHFNYEELADKICWTFPNLCKPQDRVTRGKFRRKLMITFKRIPEESVIFKDFINGGI